MLEDPPVIFEEIPIQKYAFIAGTVEKICNDTNIKPPDWVYNTMFF